MRVYQQVSYEEKKHFGSFGVLEPQERDFELQFLRRLLTQLCRLQHCLTVEKKNAPFIQLLLMTMLRTWRTPGGDLDL